MAETDPSLIRVYISSISPESLFIVKNPFTRSSITLYRYFTLGLRQYLVTSDVFPLFEIQPLAIYFDL